MLHIISCLGTSSEIYVLLLILRLMISHQRSWWMLQGEKREDGKLCTGFYGLYLEVVTYATFIHKSLSMTGDIVPYSLTRIRKCSPVMFSGAENWEYLVNNTNNYKLCWKASVDCQSPLSFQALSSSYNHFCFCV